MKKDLLNAIDCYATMAKIEPKGVLELSRYWENYSVQLQIDYEEGQVQHALDEVTKIKKWLESEECQYQKIIFEDRKDLQTIVVTLTF